MRSCGVVEQVWRALEYVLEEVEGLRAEEMELVALRGVVPCLFLSPLATSAQRERQIAHALVLLGVWTLGFARAVEQMAAWAA